MLFFDSKHEKEIYIPAFGIPIHKTEYELLVEMGKDIILDGDNLKLIDYEGDGTKTHQNDGKINPKERS